MATGAAFDHAVALARDNPRLGVGVHCVLVGEPPFPATVPKLLAALATRSIDVETELDRQIARVFDAGIRPAHLDSHKHTHLLPPVLGAVARLARKYGIRWVRRTLPMQWRLPGYTAWSERLLAQHGCRTADRFLGFRETGTLDALGLAAAIRRLPPGTTEFMCHPGFCRDELGAARTRLKDSRERELAALVSPAVRAAVEESRIRLVTYASL
jgi:predicted glycoside hydrolase/deacetylase ChbG (UPF0249 family)